MVWSVHLVHQSPEACCCRHIRVVEQAGMAVELAALQVEQGVAALDAIQAGNTVAGNPIATSPNHHLSVSSLLSPQLFRRLYKEICSRSLLACGC